MALGATSMSRAELGKAFTLEVANDAARGKSTQQDVDPYTPTQGLRPPLPLDQLAALTGISRTRRSCIAAVTLNTVGLGFEVRIREGHEGEVEVEVEAADVEQHLDQLSRVDRRLGRPSFTRQLSAVKWDQYEVGNGYLEASRNELTGEVDGLYHVPGRMVRRRGDRDGYIMGPRRAAAGDLTYFYDFGDKVQYTDDGKPTGTLKDSGRRWDTNELIALKLYTSASRDYGLPPDYQLANDYLGDKLAGQANVGYFDNSGVPPTVIFVQGREEDDQKGNVEIVVDQVFTQAIVDTLKTHPAAGLGRVAVVPVPPGTKTEAHNLAVLSDRDLGHVQFRSDNRRATLGAFRISPVFVADIEDAGKYTAEVERALTKEQVFDPDQRETADIIGQTLLREISPHLEIVFTGIAIKDDEAKRESANDLADRGKITNGEYRAAHGYPPLVEAENPDEAKGEVEIGWNAQLVKAKSSGPVAIPGMAPQPDEGAIEDPLAKGTIEGGLTRAIEAEFEASLEEAIGIVQRSSDAEIRPVIVEKRGDDSFVVLPYSENGAG